MLWPDVRLRVQSWGGVGTQYWHLALYRVSEEGGDESVVEKPCQLAWDTARCRSGDPGRPCEGVHGSDA